MNEDPTFNAEQTAYFSWDGVRGRMADSNWSEGGRNAGVWAIDQLRTILGQEWSGLRDSNYLQFAFMHAGAFGELLDIALRLHLLNDVSGMARIRRDFVRDVKPERRLHTQLLLNVASLAVQCGQNVALEKILPLKLAPTDVVLTNEVGIMGIEVFAVHMDARMQMGMIYSDRIDNELDHIRSKYGVEITGNLDSILTDLETQEWLELIEKFALRVNEDGKTRTIKYPSSSVTILLLKNSSDNEISFTGPLILGKTNFRLYEKLIEKAQQAVKAGATWIRVDVIDGLWQFTPWATWPIREKGEEMTKEITNILAKIVGLHGVVLSSGSTMCSATIDNKFVPLSGGGIAMATNLPLSRARETIIIPLHSGYENETALWSEMYSGESGWLDWALQKVGLPPSVVVLA